MTTNGDFWGLKIIGTRGKIVDLIHHCSPKVPIILCLRCGNFTKIWCKVIPNQTTEPSFILLPTILETYGDKWGLMRTIFHGDYW